MVKKTYNGPKSSCSTQHLIFPSDDTIQGLKWDGGMYNMQSKEDIEHVSLECFVNANRLSFINADGSILSCGKKCSPILV